MMLITNYITSAWRNILRHKLFSIINILGLAIGLAAVMLIALYVRYETSYDSFWKNADNIYRVHTTFKAPGSDIVESLMAPAPVIEAMKKDFPEITNFARIDSKLSTIKINKETYYDEISVVDANITSIFDFKIIAGDINTALIDRYGIIISKSRAQKYFGRTNIIGEVITIELGPIKREFKITAIIDDLPETSNLDIQAMIRLVPDDWGTSFYLNGWFTTTFQTYFTINKNTKIIDISTRLADFIDRNFPPLPFGDGHLKQSKVIQLSLMNIKDIHLNARGVRSVKKNGNLNTVIIFSVIALLILIIACINFMNLSTARATERAKEVSMRKTLGASRQNLIIQFIGESILITFFGLLIALTIVELTLPFYGEILSMNLTINYVSSDLLFCLFFATVIGFCGGIYPAFILSNFRPSEILKTNKSSHSAAILKFRHFLVIVQFSISITLFVSTSVIYSQMKFIQNLDLGYNQNNLITFFGNNDSELSENIESIQDRLTQIDNVESATWSRYYYPGSELASGGTLRTEETPEYTFGITTTRTIGYDFFKTYQIPIIAGRTYDPKRNDVFATQKSIITGEGHVAGIILNQSALRHFNLGTPSEALGKNMFINVGPTGRTNGNKITEAQVEVIGVIPDIHFKTLKSIVEPEYYALSTNSISYVTIRYSRNPERVIEDVKALWQSELPSVAFNYSFAEESLAEQYLTEQNQMIMFAAFSGLAIFIACLGLFGLAAFTAERRTKEIGVRKVFGAEIWQIVKLLVWQFSKPVLIANIIAWPIAYLAMSRWLESFVYRIDDMVIIALCLLAGLTALLIAWATVAGNSYAVARQNPIKALRYE